MIDRYTRPEMAALWTKQKKFETWLEVELNATDAWVKLGKVPAEAAAEMRKNAKFTVERVTTWWRSPAAWPRAWARNRSTCTSA